jgi:hypothetical protein
VFARFCADHKIDPHDLAELLALARRAFKAGERECNTGISADPQRERVEDKAEELGWLTRWPGLHPAFCREVTLGRESGWFGLPDVG